MYNLFGSAWKTCRISFFASMLFAVSCQGAGFFDRLGIGKRSDSSSLKKLSDDEVIGGLKEALAKGVEHAVINLGKADGFLQDVEVRIPLPSSLQKVESGLRLAGQSQLVDDFITTMNRAAEQAVPQAAGVLGESVRTMTVEDAKTILTSTNTAATDYFRRTAGTNLYELFLPTVKKATAQTGVTSAYKQMMSKLDLGGFSTLGALGGFGVNKESLDLDSYVTKKALDGLFIKIGEQERMIRENPAARTTELLQQVFGSLRK